MKVEFAPTAGRRSHRPAHLYRWRGNPDRGTDRDRRGPAHRHPQSHVAHLSVDRGRPGFRRTFGHYHQYRRSAAHLSRNPVSVSGEFQQSGSIPTEIAAHSVGTISVVFAPTQPGALTGTLTITDALQTQTVALSGTGVAPQRSASVPPASPSPTSSRAWPALRKRSPSPTPAARPWPMSASRSPAPPPPATPSPPPPAGPCSTTAPVARRRSSLRPPPPAPSRPRSLSPRPPLAWRRFRCR